MRCHFFWGLTGLFDNLFQALILALQFFNAAKDLIVIHGVLWVRTRNIVDFPASSGNNEIARLCNPSVKPGGASVPASR